MPRRAVVEELDALEDPEGVAAVIPQPHSKTVLSFSGQIQQLKLENAMLAEMHGDLHAQNVQKAMRMQSDARVSTLDDYMVNEHSDVSIGGYALAMLRGVQVMDAV